MAGSDLVHLQMDPAEELVHTSGAKQGMLQVLIEVQQSTGIITLNRWRQRCNFLTCQPLQLNAPYCRPKALNSLNTGMVCCCFRQPDSSVHWLAKHPCHR